MDEQNQMQLQRYHAVMKHVNSLSQMHQSNAMLSNSLTRSQGYKFCTRDDGPTGFAEREIVIEIAGKQRMTIRMRMNNATG